MSAPRSAAVVAALVAAVAAPREAAAFVQTRAEGTGAGLSWPVPVVPWFVNRDWPFTSPSCEASGAGDPTLAALRASFAAWEQPCASLDLVEAGQLDELRTGIAGGDLENLVVFRRGWCSQHPDAKDHPCFGDPALDCGGLFGCFEDESCQADDTDCLEWRTVALTSVLYEPDTGRILDADIEINGWDGQPDAIGARPRHGWYFTCYDGAQPSDPCASYGEDGCFGMDLRNTMTHEVGHLVGLAHVQDGNATMDASTAPGELVKRSLSQDDVDGVCAIYPDDDGGGCDSGTGGAAGALGLLVAALALRRARR